MSSGDRVPCVAWPAGFGPVAWLPGKETACLIEEALALGEQEEHLATPEQFDRRAGDAHAFVRLDSPLPTYPAGHAGSGQARGCSPARRWRRNWPKPGAAADRHSGAAVTCRAGQTRRTG